MRLWTLVIACLLRAVPEERSFDLAVGSLAVVGMGDMVPELADEGKVRCSNYHEEKIMETLGK